MTRKVGGREATTGVIPGRFCLSVGNPGTPTPAGWHWRPLLEMARLESGHTPSRRKPEYWGGNISWIGIKDATGNHGRTIHETMQYTNELGIANSAARILPKNTVCLSRTASVGYVVVMGKPMATSQDFANWVCGSDLDYRFLKYALLLENEALQRFSYGSTHRTIYYPELKAFHLCVPPLPEQREIAAILGALDDKIELNRKMAATLEAMARALYRSWFVDFDPVTARAEGRAPAHMPPATAALFPDRFGENGLPEGWSLGILGDIARNSRKGADPKTTAPDTPYVGLEHIPRRSISISDWGRAEDVGSTKSIMKKGQFLFGKLRPYFHKVGLVPLDGICSTDILVVEAKSDSWREFVLSVISSVDLVEHVNAASTGTRMPRAKWHDLANYQVVMPSSEIAIAYSKIVRPMHDRITSMLHESRTLATLRDTLLPRLMSGELRVPAARDIVGDIA